MERPAKTRTVPVANPASPDDVNANDLTAPPDLPGNDSERVARRAYERFLTRGGEHGHDREDWFEAEREMRQPSEQ